MCFFFSCAEDWQTATTEALPLHYLRGKELPSLAARHPVRPAKPLWGDVEFPYYSCGRIVLIVNPLCQESHPNQDRVGDWLTCSPCLLQSKSPGNFPLPPFSLPVPLYSISSVLQHLYSLSSRSASYLQRPPPSASWVLELKVLLLLPLLFFLSF